MIDLPTCTDQRNRIWYDQQRPYIILKWAETADGFIAPAHDQPYWISNAAARRLVHRWRSEEAAIWVGKRTYQQDNPRLNVREWKGTNPVRIVVDPELQLNQSLRVFDQSQPTLCYNSLKQVVYPNLEFVQFSCGTQDWLARTQFLLDDLHRRNFQSLFVEGGAALLSFLLSHELWDEARIFRASANFEDGVAAPVIEQNYHDQELSVDDNLLMIYRRNKVS